MPERVRGMFGRRGFVGGLSAAATLHSLSPFAALADGKPKCGPASGYGPLVDAIDETTGLPLLRLPKGFRYMSFGWTGDPMSDGAKTPGGHDGGACLHGPDGLVHYVRNHELNATEEEPASPFGPVEAIYDRGCAPGGTTTVVFDSKAGKYLKTVPSLSGTVRNCAGGPTPWNSWITCEETLDEPGSVDGVALEKTHGWVFEVPATGLGDPRPIRDMGRFSHEAIAVDPKTSLIYETEDSDQSGLFRFRPKDTTDLQAGGVLEMLKIKGHPQLDTGDGSLEVGESLDVEWVTIDDPEASTAENPAGTFEQGLEQGGAIIRRGEGAWYGNDRIYITSTSGGAAEEGQVWELDPEHDRLLLLFESSAESELDNPDNVTVSPRGGLLLCEDGDGDALYIRGLGCEGEIFDFGQNNIVLDGEVNGITGDYRNREWAGASFTPDGQWLIVSIQTPGVTFAITGPWEKGPL